jgi:putative proteasome-type protease
MTYCVAANLNAGMIFASDSRTNAGVDHVGRFCKMRIFENPGDRVIITLTSGNLSVSQGAVNHLVEKGRDNSNRNIWNCTSMYEAAMLLGDSLREVQERDGPFLARHNIDASASFLVGGQIKGEAPRLFNVYTEGNFIETSQETLFFQIGETKYGKPILDRVLKQETNLRDAAKCVLVSFDSTIRSNISVGPPIDLLVYERDSLKVGIHKRLDDSDPYLLQIHHNWSEGLRRAFTELPDMNWVDDGHPREHGVKSYLPGEQ